MSRKSFCKRIFFFFFFFLDHRLPKGPLPVSSFRWPLPPNCNFAFVSILLFTILLIVFHYLGRVHSVWLFRAHILGFLPAFLPWRVVGLSPNPQPAGLVHRIYNPPGQCGPAIFPGTGYQFWSPFTPCMTCSGTIRRSPHGENYNSIKEN